MAAYCTVRKKETVNNFHCRGLYREVSTVERSCAVIDRAYSEFHISDPKVRDQINSTKWAGSASISAKVLWIW